MHLIVKDNPMGEFHRSCICQSAREWWNGALSLYQINTRVDCNCTQCDFSFALEMRFMSHNFWKREQGFFRVFIDERLCIKTYH